jgi:asparagine synthase (glutamine-hydrolysing)
MNDFSGTTSGARSQAIRAPVMADGYQIWFRGFLAGVSDTPGHAEAAIARARRHNGVGFQSDLLGEYSYALHEPDSGAWVMGHDALGLRQLFFALNSDGIAFASRLELLLDLTGAGPIDEDYIADMFAIGAHHGGRTPFTNIQRLVPGEALIVAPDRRLRRIITHCPSNTLVDHASHPERVAKLRDLLSSSVRDAMPASGTILSELSGGLDSSTVACLLADMAPARCEFLSTVFSESPKADETAWINVVRSRHALPWHGIDADRHQPFSSLPTVFQAEPSRALLLQGYYDAIDTTVRETRAASVLTGHGGDSVLFGDTPEPFFMADQLLDRPLELLASIKAWQRGTKIHRPFLYWLSRYGLTPKWRHQLGRRILASTRNGALPSWIGRDYAREAGLQDRLTRRFLPSSLNVGRAYYWERVRTSAFWLTTDIYHRAGAADYRSPLLSLPLVEFMASLPWREQLGPGVDRLLQREAMAGVLPEQTRSRRGKRGSDAAFYLGLRRSGAWHTLLTERPRIVERGYVERTRWSDAVEKARFGFVEDIGAFLWCCALECWLRSLESYRPSIQTSDMDLPALSDKVRHSSRRRR